MARDRRTGGLPLAAYVVALLFVPLLGVALFSVREVERNNRAASEARAIADAVEVHSAAITLLAPLQVEQMAAIGLSRIDELGLDRAIATGIIGIEFDEIRGEYIERLDRSIAALDDALATSGTDTTSWRSRLDALVVDIEAARSALDARELTAAEATDVHRNASTFVDEVIAAFGLGSLGRSIDTSQATGMIDDLEIVGRVARTGQREIDAAATALLRSEGVEPFEYAAHRTRHADAIEALGSVSPDAQARLRVAHEALPPLPASAYESDLELTMSPELVQDLAGIFLADVEYLSLIEDVSRAESAAIAARAERLAEELSRDNLTAFLGLSAVVLLSIVFGTIVLRAFVRPLQQLRQQAQRIGRGELNAEPLQVEGPADLRQVTTAVNEMVATLSLLEDHMDALALDDEQQVTLRELPGPVGASMRTSVQRVTELTARLKASEARLAREARLDNLTGLPNRFAVFEHLDQLHRSPDERGRIGVMFVDIDGFKSVNDTHGHAVGDVVLREIAERLRASIREHDFVARLGGDEFLVVVRDLDGDGLRAFGGRIISEIEQPYEVGEQLFAVSASVGVTFLEPDDEPVRAIERADAAVYQAKARGRRRVESFDADLQHAIEQQAEVELALRQAIRHQELRLHLQPLCDLRTGRASGAEALVRWERPGVGLVPPGEFIPIAERSGLIFELERWVLQEACRRLSEWELRGAGRDLRLAVNISGRHLIEGELVQDLDRALALTAADPRLLEIELTESQLLDDVERASEVLRAVRERGVTVAIDDFGTGYSSMTYLQKLPVDVVKIDRTFMSRATDNGFDSTIVEAVVTIGRSLALEVVAEGIETMEQLAYAVDKGVTQAQGFLLARPMPAPEAEAIIFGGPLVDIERLRPRQAAWGPPAPPAAFEDAARPAGNQAGAS